MAWKSWGRLQIKFPQEQPWATWYALAPLTDGDVGTAERS